MLCDLIEYLTYKYELFYLNEIIGLENCLDKKFGFFITMHYGPHVFSMLRMNFEVIKAIIPWIKVGDIFTKFFFKYLSFKVVINHVGALKIIKNDRNTTLVRI